MQVKVDFHVHSTASDGTLSPVELASCALRGGYVAMALTDHDNCDGVAAYAAALAGRACHAVAGVELSIEPGAGFDRFHLLALGIEPQHPALTALLRRIREGREARNARIFENFARLGIALTPEIVRPYARGEILARPHFAQALVAQGYAAEVRTAFATYLQPDSPAATRCYEERWHPAQAEVFAAVHAAGGLCVMAHPKYWRLAWRTLGCEYQVAARELARLHEMGLDGLECFYRANTAEETIEFTRLAEAIGLLKTAGSDFHGQTKPTIPLGMEVKDSFIGPFLEQLGVSLASCSRGEA